MTTEPSPHHSTEPAAPRGQAEPRWPAFVAALAVGGLYTALPPSVAVGPKWLQLVIVAGLLIASALTHHRRSIFANRIIGHITGGVLTLFLLWSLVLLVLALPAHKEPPVMLLRSGAALWITNVLVFALWYWRLDAGGPHGRDARPGHTEGAFLFPQMSLGRKSERNLWSPRFIDYLFLAFNTSTALSPTDVPILSRWAKVMVMVQAMISLIVVVILLARAVNML